LTNLRCFFQLQVAVPRFDRYALLYKEPCEGVSRIGPVRLQGEDVGEEAVGLGGLVAVGLELGALEQGEEIGPVILAGSGGAGLHFLHDTGSLGGDVGEGLIHAFFCENAVISSKTCWSWRYPRSFLPALGLLRIGKGGLPSAFDGLKQLGADFLFRDVASFCGDPL